MAKLDLAQLSDVSAETVPQEGGWVCDGRLPEGAVVLTGIAGTPCAKKTLEEAARALFAEYAADSTVANAAAREADALYVQVEGSGSRLAKQLRSVFEEEVPAAALVALWESKLSVELAEAIGEAATEGEIGLVVVDGAQAGCEGRQKLCTVIGEMNRAGKAAGCSIVVLMPLTKRNMFCVKDPTTGIWDACEAVWEIFPDRSGAKCFCTTKTGTASAFDLKAAAGGSAKRQQRAAVPAPVRAATEAEGGRPGEPCAEAPDSGM